MKIKGKNYQERCQFQLTEWVKGNSIHNTVDNECCPDFSCCRPDTLQPKTVRETFKAVYDKGDERTKMGMLMGFLGNAIAKAYPDKKVHITDGDMINKKDLN